MTNRQTERITALYERLSRDDGILEESNSILNQKKMLEDYAKQNSFGNIRHYTDDGWSGGNFERPAWKQLISDIEAGRIKEFRRGLLQYFHDDHGDVISQLETTRDLADDVKTAIVEAAWEYKNRL